GDDLVGEEQTVDLADGKRHGVRADPAPRPVRSSGSLGRSEALREKPSLLRGEKLGREIERDPGNARERARIAAPGAFREVAGASSDLEDAMTPGPDPPCGQSL